MLRLVVLNGGRGAASLIPSFLNVEGAQVTSIVNAYDDGKSTGEIRRFFGMLGPSDIRKVQELMLPRNDPDAQEFLKLFRHRYPTTATRAEVLTDMEAFAHGNSHGLAGSSISNAFITGELRRYTREFLASLALIEKVSGKQFCFSDCSVMNCLYAGAFVASGRNLEEATLEIDRLFKLRGVVLPTTSDDKQLVALRENGEMLYCEADIVELRSNVRVERIYILDKSPDRDQFEKLDTGDKRAYLERHHCYVGISPAAELALRQADIIVYAPGTQHSSLYPTYLTTGVARTIADNRSATKVFVTNIGADYENSQLQGFGLHPRCAALSQLVGRTTVRTC